MEKVTIKDIADRLNISPATVSLALNGRPGVNLQTARKVLETAKDLKYTGSRISQKSPANMGTAGFIVCKRYGKVVTDSQFFTALISAVEHAARLKGYTIMLMYCADEAELLNTLKLSENSGLAGLLILGTELSENEIGTLSSINLPTVILDCDIFGSGFDTVTINNEDGIWRGMKYLYDAGHREIGYLRSSFSIRNFEQRFSAFKNFLNRHNLNSGERKIFMLEPTVEGAFQDVCELLRQGIKFPSAIIADNDLIALGAMKAFSQFGIKIPDDVSIVGFDDIPMSSVIEPNLTSVYVSCDSFGAAAVDRLLWRKENPDATATRLSIGTKLNIRSSVIRAV